MIFEAAVAALIIGLLLGGSFKELLELRLRGLWLLLLPVLANILPRIPVLAGLFSSWGTPAAILLSILRYGFLVAFAAFNLRNIPVLLVGAGGVLNSVVTLCNQGRMPVSPSALSILSSDQSLRLLEQGKVLTYTVASGGTRLPFLGDILYFHCYNYYFLSPGDLLIACGIFALIIRYMRPKLLVRLKNRMIGSEKRV